MTPISHTLYTLTLLFALAALKLWSDRRHHVLRACRADTPKELSGNLPATR